MQAIDGGVLRLRGRYVGSLQGAKHAPECTAHADEGLAPGPRAFREGWVFSEQLCQCMVGVGVEGALCLLDGGLNVLEIMVGDERKIVLRLEPFHGCFDAGIFS